MDGSKWRQAAVQNYDLSAIGRGETLFFHPLSRFYHRNLEQLASWADYLYAQAGLPVCRLLRNRNGRYDTELSGASWVLMRQPDGSLRAPGTPGAMLAAMHLHTSGAEAQSFPETPAGNRTEKISRRLDALEEKYGQCQKARQPSGFETLFLHNFAYFSGCAENAVQMLVDAAIDFPVADPLCAGHYRWADFQRPAGDNPAFWVVDDRSRDLAEALRTLGWQREDPEVLQHAAGRFLDDYEAVYPLTESVATKMYARLLFPLSYIECCEHYFLHADEGGHEHEFMLRLNEEKARHYESLLHMMTARYEGRLRIPEWLSHSSFG